MGQEAVVWRDLQPGNLQQQSAVRQHPVLVGVEHRRVRRRHHVDFRAVPSAQLNCCGEPRNKKEITMKNSADPRCDISKASVFTCLHFDVDLKKKIKKRTVPDELNKSTDFYEFLHICVRNRKKILLSLVRLENFLVCFENRNTGFVFCFFCFFNLDIFVFVFFFSNRTQLF